MTEYPLVSPTRSISLSTVSEARNLQAQGKTSEAWGVLAAAGDEYATQAAYITDPETPHSLKSIVKSLWITNGGQEALQRWDVVAEKHLDNYLRLMEDNGGKLPTSFAIEQSYKDAVTSFGLPTSIAIDLVLNRIEDYIDGAEWSYALFLSSDRRVTDSPISANDISKLWASGSFSIATLRGAISFYGELETHNTQITSELIMSIFNSVKIHATDFINWIGGILNPIYDDNTLPDIDVILPNIGETFDFSRSNGS